MTTYRQTTGDGEHFALTRGSWTEDEAIPVRVHAGQPRFDLLHAPAFGRGEALDIALRKLGGMERCAFVYLENGDHPWSAIHALPEGPQAVDPSTHDIGEAELKRRQGRTYGLGAQILRDLGLRKLQLVSDTAKVTKGMSLYGLNIQEVLPLRNT